MVLPSCFFSFLFFFFRSLSFSLSPLSLTLTSPLLSFFPYPFHLPFEMSRMTRNDIKKQEICQHPFAFSSKSCQDSAAKFETQVASIRIISGRSPNVAKFFIMARISATREGDEGVLEVKGNCNFSLDSKVLLCG